MHRPICDYVEQRLHMVFLFLHERPPDAVSRLRLANSRRCYGYLEDPICGLAAGAIAVYLQHEAGVSAAMTVEQGMFAGTHGLVETQARGRSVRIAGRSRINAIRSALAGP
jgi:predicted PhzF superfamily epimerase YddE/YHI9